MPTFASDLGLIRFGGRPPNGVKSVMLHKRRVAPYHHISNAGTAGENLGISAATVLAGVEWVLRPPR